MRSRFYLFIAALVGSSSLSAVPIVNEAGDLQALIDGTNIPTAASLDKYRLPTDPELAAFRSALQHILDGNLQAAADAAADANYDVVSYSDNVTTDTFALLREKNSNQHWGGLYVVDLTPERTLVVECPHPLYDGVRVPATDIFMDTNAVAYLQSGTHRNNSPTESDCDGDLGGNPYRISDMAHAPESVFQAAHEVIEAHFTRTVSLSFHGMAEGSDPADICVSNGTPTDFVGNSLSRALATRMNQIILADDPMDTRYTVSHQELGVSASLSGSTNTQGRATNRSTDLCHADAPFAIFPERFIHMEADPDVRDGESANWAFVIQALNELIPLFSNPEPDLPTGDITITEMMANPAQVSDGTGEYLELFNHTSETIDMTGWTIVDRDENVASFSAMSIIAPGDLFVVGVSNDLNGGGEPGGIPDAAWTDDSGDLTLTNGGDFIYLFDTNHDLVASISYENGNPFGVGVALEIATGNAHPSGQTLQSDYVESLTAYGADFGSPGTRGESQYPLPNTPLQPSIIGSDLHLTFPTATAVTYALWDSALLDDWDEVLSEDPVIGDGLDAEYTFPLPGDDAYFYRLEYDYAAPE